MLPHATISKLVAKVKARADKNRDSASEHGHPVHAVAAYRRGGVDVWSIEYMDGTYYLYHYETLIMVAEPGFTSYRQVTAPSVVGTYEVVKRIPVDVPGTFEVHEPPKGLSRSDRDGMNALLKALEIKAYITDPANADYGGLKGRR